MRLRSEQLHSHLHGNTTLAPVYLITGDEPLQKLESIDLVCQAARQQGFDERTVFEVEHGFDWQSLLQVSNNLSLFSNRNLIELRMGSSKPGKEGGSVLIDFTKQASEDTLLIISMDKLDKASLKTKWVKSLESHGILLQTWPINAEQLPVWLQSRARQYQKQLTLDAARLIAIRVEGNLLAARQELDKLDLLIDNNSIEVNDVINVVADSSRYNVFNMIEDAYLGNATRAITQLDGLKDEGTEPLALFGAIMWELRRTCSMAAQLEMGVSIDSLFQSGRIWDQKKRALGAVLKRHKKTVFDELLDFCAGIDKQLKSINRDCAWDQLELLMLKIAGIDMFKLKQNQFM